MQFLIFLNFAAALQGIFLTYLIVHSRLNDKKSLVLGLLTLILSISILGGVFGLSGYYKIYPHLINIADPLFLLYGPLLFFYIEVLTKNKLPPYFYLHLFPFIIYIILNIPFYMLSANEKVDFADYIFLNDQVPLRALLMQVFRVVYLTVYVFLCMWIIRKYQIRILANYSSIEEISLSQSKRILNFFLIILIISVLTFLIGYIYSISYTISNNIIGLFISIVIYGFAFSTWNKNKIFAVEFNENKSYSRSPEGVDIVNKIKIRNKYILDEDQYKKYSEKLRKAIEQDKVFVENNLSLTELSKILNIQPYQLSELIGRYSCDSFFDFINRNRVEEIKLRLKDPKYDNYSILGVAMDCGFNTKSSFNAAFKKFTGLTPSEFRNKKTIE
ncbi:MAG: helix-turn-helix domain-containing protein [Bacteroidetes bacterium]|nr:helix-turn-helix domain-containing protein [Bacteroidota bacterium]